MLRAFQLATLAGPLAGEELHGLCFLLEKVEITEDCLGSTGAGNGSSSGSAAVPPPPQSSSVINGKSGGRSVASPVLPSVTIVVDSGVSSSSAAKSVDVDGGDGDGDASGSVSEVDIVAGENEADDNASVGKGSVKSGATGSNTGERREPRQVRALPRVQCGC